MALRRKVIVMDTTPRIDPLVLGRLAEHCALLSRQLDLVAVDLRGIVTAPSAAPSPVAPSPFAAPGAFASGPVAPRPVAPRPVAASPVAPAAVDRPASPPPRPAATAAPDAPLPPPAPGTRLPSRAATPPPLPPHLPPPLPGTPGTPDVHRTPAPRRGDWFGWGREGLISRLLALAGVGVTLIGVVMMLVLAAQAGLLQPWVRVAGGALLAAALVAAGSRVADRPGGRVGGVALAATGLAAAFLDVVAVTTRYHWVPTSIGLVLAGIVTVGGMWLALRWTSQALAVIVVVAAALTGSMVSALLDLQLVGFLVLLQAGGAATDRLRRWSVLTVVRTVPVACALVTLALIEADGVPLRWSVLVTAVLVAVIGLTAGVLAARTGAHPVATAASVGLAALPVLVTGFLDGPAHAGVVPLAVAAAFWPVSYWRRAAGAPVDAVITTVGAISLLQAAIAVPTDDVVLDAAPVLMIAVVGAAICLRAASRVMLLVTAGFAVIGLGQVLSVLPPSELADRNYDRSVLGVGAVVAGVLLLALACLLVATAARTRALQLAPAPVAGLAVLVGLYALTMICVAAPIAVWGRGFHVGHFLATTAWVVAGSAILLLGLSRPAVVQASMASGLTVLAAATAKLVFFDLSALSGFTRAATFMVAGVVLLGAGTRYARAVAEVLERTRSRPGLVGEAPAAG